LVGAMRVVLLAVVCSVVAIAETHWEAVAAAAAGMAMAALAALAAEEEPEEGEEVVTAVEMVAAATCHPFASVEG